MSTAINTRTATSSTATQRNTSAVLTRLPQRAANRDFRLVLLGLTIMVVSVFIRLALSSAISQGAYEENALQQHYTAVTRDAQAAHERITTLSSGQQVIERASELGMTPAVKVYRVDAATGALSSAAGAAHVPVHAGVLPNAAADAMLGTTHRDPKPGVSTQHARKHAVPSINGIPTPNTH